MFFDPKVAALALIKDYHRAKDAGRMTPELERWYRDKVDKLWDEAGVRRVKAA